LRVWGVVECYLEDAAELVEAIVALSLKEIWVLRFGCGQEADEEEVESEEERRRVEGDGKIRR
jgi:hypothetical protein